MTLQQALDQLPAMVHDMEASTYQCGHLGIHRSRSGTWTISYAWVDKPRRLPAVKSDDLRDAAQQMKERLENSRFTSDGRKASKRTTIPSTHSVHKN